MRLDNRATRAVGSLRTSARLLLLLLLLWPISSGAAGSSFVELSLRSAWSIAIDRHTAGVRQRTGHRHRLHSRAHRCRDPNRIWISTGSTLNFVSGWKESVKPLDEVGMPCEER